MAWDTENTRRELVQRFSGQAWRWFACIEVEGRSQGDAIVMFHEWITRMRKEEGSSHFRWVRVLEKKGREHFCFHVLIGGLRRRSARWTEEWEKRGEKARVGKYANLGAIIKVMDSDGCRDIDFHLGDWVD